MGGLLSWEGALVVTAIVITLVVVAISWDSKNDRANGDD